MKKTSSLVVLLALLAFALPLAKSVHSLEKPKETKVESKSLSPDEIREFNKKIEWIQKNSSEIDKRMFDLGSKQFEVSWTTWYSSYLLLAIILTIVGVVLTLVGWIGKVWAEKYVKEMLDQEIDRLKKEMFSHESRIHGYFYWRQRNLDRAILHTEDAVKFSTKGSEDYWKAVNNLAYFYAEKGDVTHRADAIEMADELRKQFTKEGGRLEWLNTYAFVVSIYYAHFPDPKATVNDAIKILQEILVNKNATESNKDNAQAHLSTLRGILATL